MFKRCYTIEFIANGFFFFNSDECRLSLAFFPKHYWAKMVILAQFFSFKLNKAAGVGDFFVFCLPNVYGIYTIYFSKDRLQGIGRLNFLNSSKGWRSLACSKYTYILPDKALTTPGGGLGTPIYKFNLLSQFFGQKIFKSETKFIWFKVRDHIVYIFRIYKYRYTIWLRSTVASQIGCTNVLYSMFHSTLKQVVYNEK
jgi:hypothetical protein